jgi:hypothetical protein
MKIIFTNFNLNSILLGANNAINEYCFNLSFIKINLKVLSSLYNKELNENFIRENSIFNSNLGYSLLILFSSFNYKLISLLNPLVIDYLFICTIQNLL